MTAIEDRPVVEGRPVVEIAGVSKVFPPRGRSTSSVEALVGIDLTVRAGEFISLIGPSGCGKSTLLRIIGDLTSPSGGQVLVNGKPAHQARLHRDYGMVFQAPILFDWRTVQGNVELPLEISGLPRAERARRATEHLQLVELADFAGHYPWQLSGGMQQRVAIARALALDPAILLMDEPFGALDEMTRERMNMELLKIWERTNTTVVFVTHSIAEAVFLSTRVVVMSARPGRIEAIIDIDLPRVRNTETREMDSYFRLVTAVREALRGDERRRAGDTPGGPDGPGDPDDPDGDAASSDSRRVAAEGLSG
jgi:NitT/TauT family transport system ATP-binding protein